jgi:5-methylcytosine-specific restriction endonuclease McrA
MAAEDSTLKLCSTCRVEKPTDCFTKKSRMKDGLAGQCKSCVAEWWKRYYATHREQQRKRTKEYKATHPTDPVKHRAWWARNREAIAARRKARYAVNTRLQEQNRERARLWVAANLEHQRQQSREYYYEHREDRKAKVREYERANPEKVKWWGRLKANQRRSRLSAAGGKYTVEDVQKLYVLQKGKCANCRRKLKEKYHIDHRVPASRGGSNDPHNIELLCPTCNLRKSGKLPHVFAQEQGRLI